MRPGRRPILDREVGKNTSPRSTRLRGSTGCGRFNEGAEPSHGAPGGLPCPGAAAIYGRRSRFSYRNHGTGPMFLPDASYGPGSRRERSRRCAFHPRTLRGDGDGGTGRPRAAAAGLRDRRPGQPGGDRPGPAPVRSPISSSCSARCGARGWSPRPAGRAAATGWRAPPRPSPSPRSSWRWTSRSRRPAARKAGPAASPASAA